MVSSTEGGKVEEVCVAIAKKGPLNAGLQGPKLFFQAENLLVLSLELSFKIFKEVHTI